MKKIVIGFLVLLAIGVNAQDLHTVNDAKGLSVGQKAPIFQAMAADSSIFVLDSALKKGPVVVIFYRGFWCPVCNKHLSSIQDSLKMIEALGVRVIAISPEKPEYLDKMASKTDASFTLLYDEAYRIATAYDVLYNPTKGQLFTYNSILRAKIKKTHSDDSQQLPIPATYIISRSGEIIWRQFDPNYHHRSTIKDILEFFENYSDL